MPKFKIIAVIFDGPNLSCSRIKCKNINDFQCIKTCREGFLAKSCGPRRNPKTVYVHFRTSFHLEKFSQIGKIKNPSTPLSVKLPHPERNLETRVRLFSFQFRSCNFQQNWSTKLFDLVFLQNYAAQSTAPRYVYVHFHPNCKLGFQHIREQEYH